MHAAPKAASVSQSKAAADEAFCRPGQHRLFDWYTSKLVPSFKLF